MKINLSINAANFSKIYRKVHTRDPFLIQEKYTPSVLNDKFNYLMFQKNNNELEKSSLYTDMQRELYQKEFLKLLQRQQIALQRSGNIHTRLLAMDKLGYYGIYQETPVNILYALESLKKETISALNDCQVYRIVSPQEGKRPVVDGLMELEKEFSFSELQKLSQRENSTILNTWLIKQVNSEESFVALTKYIHEILKK